MEFADLVAPLSPGEFLSRYWTREAVHLRQPQRAFDAVFGWEPLNALLNGGDLTHPTVIVATEDRVIPPAEFTSDGKVVNPIAVMQHFRDGASFSVRGAGSLSPSLRPLVDCLYDTFLETVNANVYCSPSNSQGFKSHYDLHDVVVLQIEGRKHWKVFRPTTDFPIEPWRMEDDPSDSAEPYVDVTLGRGDVLYVPRGHWHYAVAVDSASLHITAGINCRKTTAFLDWLATELSQQPAWRQNLPMPEFAGAAGGSAAVSAWGDGLRRDLLQVISDPHLFQRFAEETLAAVAPRTVVQMPLSGDPSAFPVDQVTFHRPAGRPYRIDPGSNGTVTIVAGGSAAEVEGFTPEFLDRVFATSSFTIDDVRGWNPEAKSADVAGLLESLVSAGLLNAAAR